MNRQQLTAFVWLRWRLLINQLARGGVLNLVLLALLGVGVVAGAVGAFVGFLSVGVFALAQAPPWGLLLVWDGLVLAFLLAWAVGLLAELQRTDALSLDKFLHLPVSPAGAFLLNYVSSLASVTLVLFVPALAGLSLGLLVTRGAGMLLLFPLAAAFLLAVTGVSYQFQGWLASLMVNQRRRRTIVVLVTMGFVLLCQLPNLLSVFRPWDNAAQAESANRLVQEEAELRERMTAGTITPAEYQRRTAEAERAHKARVQASERQSLQQWEETAWLVNTVIPAGWLPLGAARLASADVVPALVGTLGLTAIGAVSLWRAYRTTVRLYTGQFTSGSRAAGRTPAGGGVPAAGLVARQLPWLPEPAQAVALAGLRSLLRAPEVKPLLIGPFVMALIFGSVVIANRADVPEDVRPLLAFGLACGAMVVVLFTLLQLVGNQFGFDRGGFRAYVLSPAPRAHILLGKNLAVAPLALGLWLPLLALVAAVFPLRVDHLLAVVPQFASMFLLTCLLANGLSIFAPLGIPAGSARPKTVKLVPMLLQIVAVMLLPALLAPTMAPLGIEVALAQLGGVSGPPIALALSVLECAAVVFLYRAVLSWQGTLLWAREQQILEAVAPKAE